MTTFIQDLIVAHRRLPSSFWVICHRHALIKIKYIFEIKTTPLNASLSFSAKYECKLVWGTLKTQRLYQLRPRTSTTILLWPPSGKMSQLLETLWCYSKAYLHFKKHSCTIALIELDNTPYNYGREQLKRTGEGTIAFHFSAQKCLASSLKKLPEETFLSKKLFDNARDTDACKKAWYKPSCYIKCVICCLALLTCSNFWDH